MSTTLSATAKDDYLHLIQELQLKKVQNDADHSNAVQISGRLIGLMRRLSPGEREYLDALVVLIREYERNRHDQKFPGSSGIDVLRHLMAERQMTQKQLAARLGVGESEASMILSGKRDLTKSHIKDLSEFFGVGVNAFFG
jgi:antitoxin component HigA of HigAB toxin-antitoxin module